jgi:hypothetical protein
MAILAVGIFIRIVWGFHKGKQWLDNDDNELLSRSQVELSPRILSARYSTLSANREPYNGKQSLIGEQSIPVTLGVGLPFS